jgi:hypothetical protein
MKVRSKKKGDLHVNKIKSGGNTEMTIRHSGAVNITDIQSANDTIIDNEEL